MVKVVFDKVFIKVFSKIKDSSLKLRISKQVDKIARNPKVGKPMRNVRRGTREVYVKPFRLSYYYNEGKLYVCILELYHKKKQ